MGKEIKTQIRSFLAKHFQNYDLKDDEDIFHWALSILCLPSTGYVC